MELGELREKRWRVRHELRSESDTCRGQVRSGYIVRVPSFGVRCRGGATRGEARRGTCTGAISALAGPTLIHPLLRARPNLKETPGNLPTDEADCWFIRTHCLL